MAEFEIFFHSDFSTLKFDVQLEPLFPIKFFQPERTSTPISWLKREIKSGRRIFDSDDGARVPPTEGKTFRRRQTNDELITGLAAHYR